MTQAQYILGYYNTVARVIADHDKFFVDEIAASVGLSRTCVKEIMATLGLHALKRRIAIEPGPPVLVRPPAIYDNKTPYGIAHGDTC